MRPTLGTDKAFAQSRVSCSTLPRSTVGKCKGPYDGVWRSRTRFGRAVN